MLADHAIISSHWSCRYTQVKAVNGYHALHLRSISQIEKLIRLKGLPIIIELVPKVFILVKS